MKTTKLVCVRLAHVSRYSWISSHCSQLYNFCLISLVEEQLTELWSQQIRREIISSQWESISYYICWEEEAKENTELPGFEEQVARRINDFWTLSSRHRSPGLAPRWLLTGIWSHRASTWRHHHRKWRYQWARSVSQQALRQSKSAYLCFSRGLKTNQTIRSIENIRRSSFEEEFKFELAFEISDFILYSGIKEIFIRLKVSLARWGAWGET